MKLNGGLDALIETVKRLWLLGAVLLAIALHIYQVNTDHHVLVGIKGTVDSLSMRQANSVTYNDIRFLFNQDQAERKRIWAVLERLEHVPITHRDRPVYDPRYGAIPDRMTDWFEVYLDPNGDHKEKQ